jgi:hypothetical protein
MKRLSCVDREDLPALVVAARRTSRMSAHTGAALRALGKLWDMPVIGGLASAQAHLRGFAFRNSHKSGLLILYFLVFNPSRAPQGALPVGWEASAGACEKCAGQLLLPSALHRG